MYYYLFKRVAGIPEVLGFVRAVYFEIDHEGSGLMVVKASRDEHLRNLRLPNIEEILLDDAQRRVAKHLPTRQVTMADVSGEEKIVEVEAEDVAIYEGA